METLKLKPTRWRSKPRPKMRKKKPLIKWIRCSGCNELYTLDNPCTCVQDHPDPEEE